MPSEGGAYAFGDVSARAVPVHQPGRLQAAPRRRRLQPRLQPRTPDIVLMAITSQLRPTPQLGEVWIDR